MAKRSGKIHPCFVPVPGEIRQGLLFGDARTPQQNAVLTAADGSRTLEMIAAECALPREECEKIVAGFLTGGDLRPADMAQMLQAAQNLRHGGQIESAIRLLQHVIMEYPQEDRPRFALAELFDLCARPKEAAGIYDQLAAGYTREGRLGQALSCARKAAELQPGNWQQQNALARLCILTGRSDEAARVWRAYARRLANIENFEQALKIIDDAAKTLPGNDILFYAEAEILSAMERKNNPGGGHATARSAAAASENPDSGRTAAGSEKKNSPRGWGLRLSGYLAAALVLLTVCAAAYDYQARESMRKAVEISADLLDAAAAEPVYRRPGLAGQAWERLQRAAPTLVFMQTPEFNAQLQRVEAFREISARELEALRQEQASTLERWRAAPAAENIAALRALAQDGDEDSPAVHSARELYAQWVRRQDQRGEELRGLLDILNNRTLPEQERFGAYSKLAGEFPQSFSVDYPQGCRNLTVPSSVLAYDTNKRQALPVTLLVNGKILPPGGELPLDPQADIRVLHPGFALPGKRQQETSLPRPFTYRQVIILEKTVRERVALNFTPEECVLFNDGKNALAVGDGALAILDAAGARVVGDYPIPADAAATTARRLELARLETRAFLRAGERILMLDASSPQPSPVMGVGSFSGGIRPAHLSTLAGNDGVALLAFRTGENGAAKLTALSPFDGSSVFPAGPAGIEDASPSGPPVGRPFYHGWNILHLSADGKLHVALENGEPLQTLELAPGGTPVGEPEFLRAPGGGAALLVLQTAEHILCYHIDSNPQPLAALLWKQETQGFYGDVLQHGNMLILCRAGEARVIGRALATGEIVQSLRLEQPLTARAEIAGDILLLPQRGGERGGLLSAQRIVDGVISPVLWDIELPVPARAISALRDRAGRNHLALTQERELWLLDF